MAKTLPQMLTANRLRDGDVLYWKDGGWVLWFKDGTIFTDPAEADAALAASQQFVAANKVVAPYLFEVRLEEGQVQPVKEREIVRAAGPSVQRHLGKQAGQAHETFDV